jgi:uncharacterized protein (DUF1501 family)
MPSRRQFLRNTTASGLTAGLLSSCVTRQDRSTRGARATFFVGGANASNANPGKASAPFATIQAAAHVAQPGDVVTRCGLCAGLGIDLEHRGRASG